MTDLTPLLPAARDLLALCKRRGLTIATAESCTGGLVAAVLTEIPGCSAAMERGFVTYSNEAKISLLGVPATLIERVGAVSEEVARAMAAGALANSPADLAVAITGIAGPDGGSEDKPIGLVHFAAARRDGEVVHAEKRFGDIGRAEVRLASAQQAIAMLAEMAEGSHHA
jgi:nicotinamide-nucleotide amidase